jgi:hypothetical protein
MYQSSACSGVLYVARYLFLNILFGIPLTIAILIIFIERSDSIIGK